MTRSDPARVLLEGDFVDALSDNPVQSDGSCSRWTTVNAEEALPGVITPLTWTFYFPSIEYATRRFWAALGALPRREVNSELSPGSNFYGIFAGRIAINLDRHCAMCDLIPGTSGAEFEGHLFPGEGIPGPATSSFRRYPRVAAVAPLYIVRAGLRMNTLTRDVPVWRRECLAAIEHGVTYDRVAEMFIEARARVEEILIPHILISMVAQGFYNKVLGLATYSGNAGLTGDLVKTATGTPEFHVVSDLWAVSRDELGLDEFINRHGFHGPNEEHLSGRSWREDPAPVVRLVEMYRAKPDSDSPVRSGQQRIRGHQAARATVLSAVGPFVAVPARFMFRFAAQFVALREHGRANLLRSVDVGRACSRVLGERLADLGAITDPDDALFLTADELLDFSASDYHGRCRVRRDQHRQHSLQVLPVKWAGTPEFSTPSADGSAWDGELQGIPGSPGIVEGTARVMLDPDDDFEPNDILVCHTTDPGWAPVFSMASALVIDIGSPMSHGAIVARELGIPCVINTMNGTARIQDGDKILVDGHKGMVARQSDDSRSPVDAMKGRGLRAS